MRGRTPDPSRAAAIAAGDPTYNGQACKRCAGTLRYVSNWGCVTCNERKKQLRRGTTYQGKPCLRGHDGMRYTNGHQCVACKRKTSEDQRIARKQPQKRVSAPVAASLAQLRAERTAKQRRAMGLPA